jgi:large subunit ribosomal protein L25
MNSLVQVEVDGKKTRTLPKDVAFDPVTDRPLHVDFFRLAKGAKVQVNIPVVFINEEDSPGLKRGGVMNVVRHELDLMCDADHIPDQIEIDVTGLEIGDSIHISHVTLPTGAESSITDRDFTIAGVTAPSALKSSDDEAEEDAADETEVTEQDADTAEGEDN